MQPNSVLQAWWGGKAWWGLNSLCDPKALAIPAFSICNCSECGEDWGTHGFV